MTQSKTQLPKVTANHAERDTSYTYNLERVHGERELCLVIYCCITNYPKTQWLETETSYYLSQFWRLTGISWMVFCSTCCWRTLQLFGGQTELVCPRWHTQVAVAGTACWLGVHLKLFIGAPQVSSMWLLPAWQQGSEMEHSKHIKVESADIIRLRLGSYTTSSLLHSIDQSKSQNKPSCTDGKWTTSEWEAEQKICSHFESTTGWLRQALKDGGKKELTDIAFLKEGYSKGRNSKFSFNQGRGEGSWWRPGKMEWGCVTGDFEQ